MLPMGGEKGVLIHLLIKMLIKVNQQLKNPYMQEEQFKNKSTNPPKPLFSGLENCKTLQKDKKKYSVS